MSLLSESNTLGMFMLNVPISISKRKEEQWFTTDRFHVNTFIYILIMQDNFDYFFSYFLKIEVHLAVIMVPMMKYSYSGTDTGGFSFNI